MNTSLEQRADHAAQAWRTDPKAKDIGELLADFAEKELAALRSPSPYSGAKVPDDSYGAFAYFVSQCATGLCKELVEKGKTEVQARNAVIHCFLDMASGEACRVARGEGRDPDRNKWRDATDKAFARAVKRTNSNPPVMPDEGEQK